jgi:outer membrane protein assembly factor BamB
MVFNNCNKKEENAQVKNSAKIMFAIGDVQVKTGKSWNNAREKMELTEGNEIKTGPGAQCNLVVGSESFISVKEKSHLILATLFKDVSGMENSSIELKVGKSVLNPKKLLKGESFSVKTPTAIAAVRGTRFVVESKPQGKMKVAVVDGKVELKRRIPALEKVEKEIINESETLTTLNEKVEDEKIIVDANQSAFINNKVAEEENKVIKDVVEKHVEEIKVAAQKKKNKKEEETPAAGKEEKADESVVAREKEINTVLKDLKIMKKKKKQVRQIVVSKEVVEEDKKDVKELNTFIDKVKKQAVVEEKKVTELIIKSPVRRGEIFVNSKSAGFNEVKLNPVPGAKLDIVVSAPRYEKFRQSITLKEGEKRVIAAEFIKSPVLTVVSPVRNGRIYVNSRYLGRGKAVYYPESGSSVKIEIIARGFKKFNSELSLKPGEERMFRASLEKSKDLSRVKWSEKYGANISISPVYYKNMVIIGTGDGLLLSLNKDGKKIWRANLKRSIESTPVIRGGNIYVITNSGDFYSLKVRNGKRNWKKKVYGALLFGSKPLIVDKKIYLGTSYGRIYAFTTGGKELWKKDINNGIYSSPAYSGGMVFFGAEDQKIYALSASDGDIKWKFKADSRMVSSSPVIHGKTLYIGCYSGTFFAIDTERGKERWNYKTGDSVFSSPAIHGNSVIFGSNDGYLYRLSLSKGSLVWKFNTGSKITTKPSVKKNRVYITSGKKIFALNSANGRQVWQHRFGKDVKTSATVVGNDIYLGLDKGELTSVRDSLKDIKK